MAGAITIAWQQYLLGLILILASRAADGLDGAVARANGSTSDRGGFLDIVLDFLFYSSIPFAFALAAPEQNAVAAAFLIWSFIGTGASFLGYAVIAEKRGISTDARGRKSLFYLGGLTEGAETILFLCLVCLWPQHLPSWLGFLPHLRGSRLQPEYIWVGQTSRTKQTAPASLDLANPCGRTNPLGGQQALVHQSP